MSTRDDELVAQIKERAPGFYTENDGGDWYVVTPDHSDRIAEGFARRNDARRCLLWLAGGDKPSDMRPGDGNDLAVDLHITGQGRATIWRRALRQHFPSHELAEG